MPLPTTLAGRSQSAYYLAYDSFTRADAGSLGNTEPVGPLGGAVVRAWQTGAGSTWAIVSGEVVDTPTLGSELVSNPEFTVNTVGWNGGAGVTLTRRDYTAAPDIDPTGGTDDFGCEIATIGAGGKLMYQNIAMVNGNWYRHQCRGYAPSANTDVNAATLYSGYMSTTGTPHVTAEDVWETLMLTGRSTSTLQILVTVSSTAGDMIHTDAFSAKQLTLNTLFASVEMGVASVDLQAEIDTLVDNTEAGLVLNLDSVATPANFVIGYHDGTNAKLEKCVAGTYTSVISAAAAYAAGATIRVLKNGTSYSLYYNGVQVGITSTISDAGIVSNTRHGLFSTYSGNQLDNFQCLRV